MSVLRVRRGVLCKNILSERPRDTATQFVNKLEEEEERRMTSMMYVLLVLTVLSVALHCRLQAMAASLTELQLSADVSRNHMVCTGIGNDPLGVSSFTTTVGDNTLSVRIEYDSEVAVSADADLNLLVEKQSYLFSDNWMEVRPQVLRSRDLYTFSTPARPALQILCLSHGHWHSL